MACNAAFTVTDKIVYEEVCSAIHATACNAVYSAAAMGIRRKSGYNTTYWAFYNIAIGVATSAANKAKKEGKTPEEIVRVAVVSSFQSIINEDKNNEPLEISSTSFDEENVINTLLAPFSADKLEESKKMLPICKKYVFFNIWEIIQVSLLDEKRKKEKEEKFFSIITALGIGNLLTPKVTIPLLREAAPCILPDILFSIVGYVGSLSREEFMEDLAKITI